MLPRSNKAGTDFGRELERLTDIIERPVEPVQRTICRGAVDQRVDAGRIGVEHAIEIRGGLIVPSSRPSRLGALDQQVRFVRPQFQCQTGGRIGARGVTGQRPGLPGLVENPGAQALRRPHHGPAERFETLGRLFVPLQPYQRDGEAMVCGMPPAAFLPLLRPLAAGFRIVARQLHAALVGSRIGCGRTWQPRRRNGWRRGKQRRRLDPTIRPQGRRGSNKQLRKNQCDRCHAAPVYFSHSGNGQSMLRWRHPG